MPMLMRGWLAAWFAVSLVGQQPAWLWHELPGATTTVLAIRWDVGYDQDLPAECGASRVVLECRLERARTAVPGTKASAGQVDGGTSAAFVMVDKDQSQLALQFVVAMLDDRAPLSDDAIARVTARVALAADDAEWLYPGEVLASRSRSVLWAGTGLGHSVAGSPTAVQGLTPGRVRELLGTPCPVEALGLGSLPPDLRARAEALGLIAPGKSVLGDPVPREPVAGATSAGIEQIGNPRTDAMYVAAAFVVPAAVDRAALAVGLEVGRVRASHTLPPRPEEAMARAPRIAWSWLHGDPVVNFCRRGPNGAALDRPRQELERLLADLRDNPPTVAEVTSAVQTLDFELSLPPWSSERAAAIGAAPAALPGRAIALLLAARRRIDGAASAGVTVAAVQQALAATLAPARTRWFAVVPTAAVVSPVPASSR